MWQLDANMSPGSPEVIHVEAKIVYHYGSNMLFIYSTSSHMLTHFEPTSNLTHREYKWIRVDKICLATVPPCFYSVWAFVPYIQC